mmetsp:Transcript_54414/g.154972  ORF Transcript_54414/g.154972 Transcript_54414/m.154972 type:complete len:219 (+) Transcript_54414:91-747(+)
MAVKTDRSALDRDRRRLAGGVLLSCVDGALGRCHHWWIRQLAVEREEGALLPFVAQLLIVLHGNHDFFALLLFPHNPHCLRNGRVAKVLREVALHIHDCCRAPLQKCDRARRVLHGMLHCKHNVRDVVEGSNGRGWRAARSGGPLHGRLPVLCCRFIKPQQLVDRVPKPVNLSILGREGSDGLHHPEGTGEAALEAVLGQHSALNGEHELAAFLLEGL